LSMNNTLILEAKSLRWIARNVFRSTVVGVRSRRLEVRDF